MPTGTLDGSGHLQVDILSASGSNQVIGKVGIDQTTPGTTNGVQINAISACKLTKGGLPGENVTCTGANTDYPAAAAMPAATKYVTIYSVNACLVSMGEATSSTVGVYVGAGVPVTFPVTVTGTEADDKPHAQSATAGAVVRFTYMKD